MNAVEKKSCPLCKSHNFDLAGNCNNCRGKVKAVVRPPIPAYSAPVPSTLVASAPITPEYLCLKCGYLGFQKKYMKGSFQTELLIWGLGLVGLLILVGVLILIFALGYSLWRLVNKYMGCPACGEAGMISVHSPVARKFLADMAK
jgi:hypothetical protein